MFIKRVQAAVRACGWVNDREQFPGALGEHFVLQLTLADEHLLLEEACDGAMGASMQSRVWTEGTRAFLCVLGMLVQWNAPAFGVTAIKDLSEEDLHSMVRIVAPCVSIKDTPEESLRACIRFIAAGAPMPSPP